MGFLPASALWMLAAPLTSALAPSRWPTPPPSYMRVGGLILGSSAVLCTWTPTQEGLNWGTTGEGLPQGKRDTPPTRGLEVGRKGPRLLRRHPPFQAQSPLSLPPAPLPSKAPVWVLSPSAGGWWRNWSQSPPWGGLPLGSGEEGVSPSRGWGGGCNAFWLQEGTRTQSFGPLM